MSTTEFTNYNSGMEGDLIDGESMTQEVLEAVEEVEESSLDSLESYFESNPAKLESFTRALEHMYETENFDDFSQENTKEFWGALLSLVPSAISGISKIVRSKKKKYKFIPKLLQHVTRGAHGKCAYNKRLAKAKIIKKAG